MDLLSLPCSLVLEALARKAVRTWAARPAIWEVNNVICCISGHPRWELVVLPGRRHRAASVVLQDDGSLTPRGLQMGGLSLAVIQY